MARRFLFLIVTVYLAVHAQSVHAQVSTIGLRPVLTHLDSPVYLTNAGDGSDRLFVVEQRGKIKVVQPGSEVTTDFLNVSALVSQSGGERGLLGLAFHPEYATNRRFFIFYTKESDGAVEIAEYAASVTDANVAVPTPVRVIISIPHPVPNHNGGTVLFGPDGYLYAAIGDGTGGNDSDNNAQNIRVLLGKFIRIDVNTPVGQVPAYNIPPGNPFAGPNDRGSDEIWAFGLRNPYRFSFDRGGTHQLWVGDVGQEAIEEVDIITPGSNYGWRVFEGNQCTNLDPELCIPGNYTPPVLEYASIGPTPRCSVTGGHVYRGPQGTFSPGAYVFADFCTGEIFTWFNNSMSVRLSNTSRLVTAIGEDESGELYLVGLGGTVDKIERRRSTADFDGDLRTDISVFRPSTGTWYVLNTLDGSARVQTFGLNGDIPTAADFDGDHISDICVYRPSTGFWYYFRSSDGTVTIAKFGIEADIPTAADFDGDGKADLSVFRPSNGTWYVFSSVTNLPFQRQFGTNGDVPVPGDYDGDARNDLAVWRPGTGVWYWINSFSDVVAQRQFGLNGDIPAQGDFDGDRRTDVAVFRPSQGTWYTTHSQSQTVHFTQWGINKDVPVVGDYDGDSLDDIAVFRPANGVWYRLSSSNQATVITQFGMNGDLAVPRYAGP